MKRFKRLLIPGAVAALAVALIIPAVAGARGGHGARGGGPMGHPEGPLADLHSEIAVLKTLRALNITQEQAAQLADLSKEAQALHAEAQAKREEFAATLEGPLDQYKQDLLAGREPSAELLESLKGNYEQCGEAKGETFEKMADLAERLHGVFTEEQIMGFHDSFRMRGDRMREGRRDRMHQRMEGREFDHEQFRQRMEERRGEFKGSKECDGTGMKGHGHGKSEMGFHQGHHGGPGFEGREGHGFGLMKLLMHPDFASILASMEFPGN